MQLYFIVYEYNEYFSNNLDWPKLRLRVETTMLKPIKKILMATKAKCFILKLEFVQIYNSFFPYFLFETKNKYYFP